MKNIKNRFGEGILYSIQDILNNPSVKIYCECAACMSVYTDMLSYLADNPEVKYFSSKNSKDVTDIIILGCQVTDLAVLNDIRTAEKLHNENPRANVYMCGCLAQRFDIELPDFIKRLDVVRNENAPIKDNLKNLVVWQKPFWIKEVLGCGDYDNGNLFRNSNSIKIGAGCTGRCKYCTIRDTRGDNYERDAYLQVEEFLNTTGDIVFISDSPTYKQVRDWCNIAICHNKPVSFRNLEPVIANMCSEHLLELAKKGLLKTLHVPIQSENEIVLKAMNRNVDATIHYIDWSQKLREYGVKLATNIIIDYEVDGEVYHNLNTEFLNKYFDYFAWNPYFDGKWERRKAETRFKKYIEQSQL